MDVKLPALLLSRYLAWQADINQKKTEGEFAEYLGFPQTTVSAWMNGKRQPKGENITKLADKLGLEVYDALDLPRPEENYHYVTSNWDKLSSKEKRAVKEQMEKYVAGNKNK